VLKFRPIVSIGPLDVHTFAPTASLFIWGKYDSPESKEAYGRILAEMAANPAKAPSPKADAGLMIVELCAAYWEFCQGYYRKDGKPSRHIEAVRLAIRELKSLYGETPATEFGPRSLKALREALIQKNQSRRYVNDQIDNIKRMFKWGVSEELLPPSTYHALASVAAAEISELHARLMGTVRSRFPYPGLRRRLAASIKQDTKMPALHKGPAVLLVLLNATSNWQLLGRHFLWCKYFLLMS
jgi:hypothetical protein